MISWYVIIIYFMLSNITFKILQVDLGIEYNRYLKEVVETLEKDDAFRKKLETADEADIRVCNMYYVISYKILCPLLVCLYF